MSANNAKEVVESRFRSAISNLAVQSAGSYCSDLYLQVDRESGELQLYDESEILIDKVIVYDWLNMIDCDDTQFLQQVITLLKSVLNQLVAEDAFEQEYILKPFSVSLTDENFSVIEELLFLDDDHCRLDDPFLKELNEDLDKFLSELLSDFE